MHGFGPEDRELFEERATALYEEAVSAGGLRDDDQRIKPGGDDREAFDLLISLGLLMHDQQAGIHQPVDPSAVQSRVVAPMSQLGAELIAESGEWARTFGSLAHAWRRSPAAVRGPFTELRGGAIQEFISSVVADAQTELLTAQPQTGRSTPASHRDVAALQRGVKMRTLYQHSARRSAITHSYVAAVTAHGAEVRTLDEFFNRLIVVDRQIAVIPSKVSIGAMAVREPSLVDYLVDMFERHWERARPYANRENTMLREVAAEQRAMTIRMLIEGHADPGSAKRLGVSPRTYAGYVADLKTEYEAETRFQLGYTLGSQGVSGQEPARDDASEGRTDVG
ncbi:MAG: LuxR family transcriptional regulator [Nocardioidaceae bacterium]|nr:LuxR family transcriptional regulator [Nocardioidaceae bacterium]